MPALCDVESDGSDSYGAMPALVPDSGSDVSDDEGERARKELRRANLLERKLRLWAELAERRREVDARLERATAEAEAATAAAEASAARSEQLRLEHEQSQSIAELMEASQRAGQLAKLEAEAAARHAQTARARWRSAAATTLVLAWRRRRVRGGLRGSAAAERLAAASDAAVTEVANVELPEEVDDEGALLATGSPTGALPNARARAENYMLVRGSKYATAAEKAGSQN